MGCECSFLDTKKNDIFDKSTQEKPEIKGKTINNSCNKIIIFIIKNYLQYNSLIFFL